MCQDILYDVLWFSITYCMVCVNIAEEVSFMNRKAYEEIDRYLDALTSGRPPEWEQLPDIGLYMDQVIGYLNRQLGPLIPSEKERSITSSMINNYAKAKIIPRAESKKYSQEHIALLLSIFMLKKSLSVQDMGALLDGYAVGDSFRAFYERFRAALTECADSSAKEIRTALGARPGPEVAGPNEIAVDEANVRTLALKLAVEASLRSLAAERLLAMLAPTETSKSR